jgi:hypothetical protein
LLLNDGEGDLIDLSETRIAFVRATVRVAVVFMAALSINPAIGQDNVRLDQTHFPAVAYGESYTHPVQIERLIAALAGEWTTADTDEGSGHKRVGRPEHS